MILMFFTKEENLTNRITILLNNIKIYAKTKPKIKTRKKDKEKIRIWKLKAKI